MLTPISPIFSRTVIVLQTFSVTIFGGHFTPQLCILNEEYLIGAEFLQSR